MKLICFPFQSHHFYLKPESAILRNGSSFYTPNQTSNIKGALALVVKIDRLGRHIIQKYAHRYYHETALGFCLYAADILEDNRSLGVSWAPACALDYSAPLSVFFPIVSHPNFMTDVYGWESWSGVLIESIDEVISFVSQSIFLKMGDLIWFELHPPLPIISPSVIHVTRNGEVELQFGVK